MKKLIAFLVILIMLTSSEMLGSSRAQTPLPSYIPQPSYPTPSIPEFTVELLGPSYTQPTTYIFNVDNGQIEAQIGFTNEYSTVSVTIKNQPFTSFDSGFNGPVSLMYDIRIKDHQSTDGWSNVYTAYDSYPSQVSGTSTTELGISIQGVRGFGSIAGLQIDIQVQAMIGTVHRMIVGGFAPWFLDGQVSGWSNTQTLNVPANTPLSAPSTSPSSTETTATPPTVLSYSSTFLMTVIAITVVIIALLLFVIAYLLLYIRKRKIN